MMKISLAVILLTLVSTPAWSDEVLPGFLIKRDNGEMKACFVVSDIQAICWTMHPPAEMCTPTTKDQQTLICNSQET